MLESQLTTTKNAENYTKMFNQRQENIQLMRKHIDLFMSDKAESYIFEIRKYGIDLKDVIRNIFILLIFEKRIDSAKTSKKSEIKVL